MKLDQAGPTSGLEGTHVNRDTLVRAFASRTGFANPDSTTERHLRDLEGIFADAAAYEAACRQENPLVYSVQTFAPEAGEGDLHTGFGRIEPGTVGNEFYMTKGHVHSRAEMAEVYVGLSGVGLMLLKGVGNPRPAAVELSAGRVVYVPGHTAHRTVNVGDEPLCYFGVYSAVAGHDYSALARDGFGATVLRSRHGAKILHRGEELSVTR